VASSMTAATTRLGTTHYESRSRVSLRAKEVRLTEEGCAVMCVTNT
jgi:hypothetical protein